MKKIKELEASAGECIQVEQMTLLKRTEAIEKKISILESKTKDQKS